MSDLTKRFQKIMKDIENNISDEKQFEYINKKIAEISMLHMDIIDEMANIIKNKIENIEKVQSSIENKVTGIESDIYEDSFDFEIVCPYCNNEFTADIESKSDIRCPECNNVIELDWNGDETTGCPGSCSSCGSNCGGSFLDDDLDEDFNNHDDDDDM